MRKVYLLFISIAIVLSIAIGCEKTEPIQKELKIVNFYYQDGTPALTVAKLAKENPKMDEMIKDIILSTRKQALLSSLERDLLENARSQENFVVY